MNVYIILLRGINVGGKNKIPMTELRLYLKEEGFNSVKTYIQSGNIILQSNLGTKSIGKKIETILSRKFNLDSKVKTLVLTRKQFQKIINNKPKGFGEHPGKYHSDAIFLMDINSSQAMSVFSPKKGIDMIWPKNGIIYSQRLSSHLTKSRLNKIVGTPLYRNMTIRNWNTTTKLLKILKNFENRKKNK